MPRVPSALSLRVRFPARRPGGVLVAALGRIVTHARVTGEKYDDSAPSRHPPAHKKQDAHRPRLQPFRTHLHLAVDHRLRVDSMVVPLGSVQPVFALPLLEDIPDGEEDAPVEGLALVRNLSLALISDN